MGRIVHTITCQSTLRSRYNPWAMRSWVAGLSTPLCAAFILTAAWTHPVRAASHPSDYNGDGVVDAQDETLFRTFFGSESNDPDYEPSADGNGDAAIDALDLGLFGDDYGATGGDVDTTPPSLFVTLNDIPDDMNDLLVVPPSGFIITIDFDPIPGAVIDRSSLSVTNDQPLGIVPAGTELAPLFTVTQTGARWKIPPVTALAPRSHYLSVSVQDHAGNTAAAVYGFAVRDFGFSGPPMASQQLVFLDFDQDRSLGPEPDFIEDLRTFHLSSTAAPQYETQMRSWVITEILERVRPFYALNPDGSAGPDAVDIAFTDTEPGGIRSRLCVGGQSQLGAQYLGSTILDVNNINEAQDECNIGAIFGVFPQALDDLWSADAEFQAVFWPLDPAQGGVPVGEHALDPIVLAPGFYPGAASAPELARWTEIENGVQGFSQAIASATAHETGHLVGLVAFGAAPGGLFGASDHNVVPGGGTPAENYLMNEGGSFTFAELTGRAGESLPTIRALNWAYLHDRIVLDGAVTGLFEPPTIASVDPPVIDLSGGAVPITVHGDDFMAPPTVRLLEVMGDPTPDEILGEALLDPQTITGSVDPLIVSPALYDVLVINPDGQTAVLPGGLLVQ